MHVDHVKKSFAQKVGALKRMKKPPVKVLEEIYFKSIIPAVTYGIVVWEGGGGTGGKSPFSLLSEPISPSSLLFWANFSLLPKQLRFFFSLLPTFSPYFSLLPTLFGPFLPPPYSVPPSSLWGNCSSSIMDSLNAVQARAARVIYLNKSLAKLNWLPISYI